MKCEAKVWSTEDNQEHISNIYLRADFLFSDNF